MNTTENKVIFQSKDLGVSFLEGSIFNLEFSADGGVKPDNLIGATLNNQTINLTLNFEPPGTEFPFEPVNITGENNGYNYSAVLYASLLFYESQRSGKLPQNKRISWRGDSMLNDAKDGSKQIDLVGGYFSEGDDFNKDSRKIAGFTTMLAWGVIQYEDAYIEANQLKYVHDAIRWSTDYLMKVRKSKVRLIHVDINMLFRHIPIKMNFTVGLVTRRRCIYGLNQKTGKLMETLIDLLDMVIK